MQQINFRTANPQQAGDRVSAIQTAVHLDEVNHHAVALYTADSAIMPGGKAFLRANKAATMTLVQPAAGPQIDNGTDGATLKIIALDAFKYTVKTAAEGINGDADLITFGGDVGASITLDAFGGEWYVSDQDLLGVTLSVAPVAPKPVVKPVVKPGPVVGASAVKHAAPFGGFVQA